MNRFDGVWVSTRQENLDAFLKALGANLIARGAAKTATTTLDIRCRGDEEFVVKTTTCPFSNEKQIKLGETINDKGPVGDKVTGTWKMDGDDLLGEFITKNEAKIIIKRSVVNDETIVQTMSIGSVCCTRWFKKK